MRACLQPVQFIKIMLLEGPTMIRRDIDHGAHDEYRVKSGPFLDSSMQSAHSQKCRLGGRRQIEMCGDGQ